MSLPHFAALDLYTPFCLLFPVSTSLAWSFDGHEEKRIELYRERMAVARVGRDRGNWVVLLAGKAYGFLWTCVVLPWPLYIGYIELNFFNKVILRTCDQIQIDIIPFTCEIVKYISKAKEGK